MTITFWSPDAPKKTEIVTCLCCDGTGKIGDDDCLDCEEGLSLQVVSSLPEINMANGNATAYLKQLNPAGACPPCGTWLPGVLPAILRKVQALQADPYPLVTADQYHSASYYVMGRTEESVRNRLAQFITLLQGAIDGNYKIVWN